MTLRDDLIAARALIDTPEKWGKGRSIFRGPAKPLLCAIDACYAVSKAQAQDSAHSVKALESHLRPGYVHLRDDDGLAVVRFNDDPATTHADIMALFQRAIDAASPSSMGER